ncbi:acyl carrier protein [Streptomyces sp. NPDC017056]|uniref:acyl carrier protein n=1 Tax=Streptomyces sp. NPDC017056 TaxID=3364973 RepID=UPI003799D5A2
MLTPDISTDSIVELITDFLTNVDVIDAGDVTLDGDFEAMGVDSLVIIELSLRLKNEYGLELDTAQLHELGTVRDVADHVRSELVSA